MELLWRRPHVLRDEDLQKQVVHDSRDGVSSQITNQSQSLKDVEWRRGDRQRYESTERNGDCHTDMVYGIDLGLEVLNTACTAVQ